MKPMQGNQKSMIVSRREYERVPFMKRLTVMNVETGQQFDASGIDISVKGIGFCSKKFFPKDSRVAIQVWLNDVSEKDPVWINATVKWSKLEQEGAFMGVQFDYVVKPAQHPKLYEMIYEVMRMLILGSTII